MPKQKSTLYLNGIINKLTFCKMDGTYLVGKKKPLDKRLIGTNPAFANSLKSSGLFAVAVALASEVYATLPNADRKKGVIGRLTGITNTLLHEGKKNTEAIAALKKINSGT